jgi:hypothetical protein
MSALIDTQQALVAALLSPRDAHARLSGERGFDAYRNNAQALATRSLQASFPTLARWLGEDNTAGLAWAAWRATPPRRGDLAQWGHDLAAFLSAEPGLQDEAWLPDLARLEWALHQAQTARDPVPDLDSLQRLRRDDPEHLSLVLAPGLAWVESRWPIASLLHLWQADPIDAQAVQACWDRAEAETAQVWRRGLRPLHRAALAGETDFLRALLAGASLGQALERTPAFDFAIWLERAVREGLLLGTRAVSEEKESC